MGVLWVFYGCIIGFHRYLLLEATVQIVEKIWHPIWAIIPLINISVCSISGKSIMCLCIWNHILFSYLPNKKTSGDILIPFHWFIQFKDMFRNYIYPFIRNGNWMKSIVISRNKKVSCSVTVKQMHFYLTPGCEWIFTYPMYLLTAVLAIRQFTLFFIRIFINYSNKIKNQFTAGKFLFFSNKFYHLCT